MGFSGQEHWSGVPFPLPGDLPDWTRPSYTGRRDPYPPALPRWRTPETRLLMAPGVGGLR